MGCHCGRSIMWPPHAEWCRLRIMRSKEVELGRVV